MRYRILTFILGTWLGACSAASASGEDGPPPPALLSDPSLATSAYFPPSTTTAGVAEVGSTLGSRTRSNARKLGCAPANPCAVTSPATDFVMPVRAD